MVCCACCVLGGGEAVNTQLHSWPQMGCRASMVPVQPQPQPPIEREAPPRRAGVLMPVFSTPDRQRRADDPADALPISWVVLVPPSPSC